MNNSKIILGVFLILVALLQLGVFIKNHTILNLVVAILVLIIAVVWINRARKENG